MKGLEVARLAGLCSSKLGQGLSPGWCWVDGGMAQGALESSPGLRCCAGLVSGAQLGLWEGVVPECQAGGSLDVTRTPSTAGCALQVLILGGSEPGGVSEPNLAEG